MLRPLLAILLLVSIPLPAAQKQPKQPKQQEVKVQKTSVSREKEIEIGKQAAAEVERQMEIIKNPEIEGWLNEIGQKLAKTPQAGAYPYYFKLLHDDSINAFALPGGPMFVHTGLIKASDNEAQVAGVLAHEMSHVALRHSMAQMGRANTWQTILGVAGAASDAIGGQTGAIIGTAVQTGGVIGVTSMLSKYSRSAERDADLNGARMVANVGYDPIEVARFFDKLEAFMGEEGKPKGLDAWFASHPNPGKRVQYVSEDIKFYPKKTYNAGTGKFDHIRQVVNALPPPKMMPAQAMQPIKAQPRQGLPQGFSDLQLKDVAVAYPSNWKPGQGQKGGGIYIVPEGGATQSQQGGGVELILGCLLDYYRLPDDKRDLKKATSELLQAIQQGDKELKIDGTESTTVGGKQALITRLKTRTSYQKDPEQIVEFFTVMRPAGLWTFALAAPASFYKEAEPIFRQMIQSIKFAD